MNGSKRHSPTVSPAKAGRDHARAVLEAAREDKERAEERYQAATAAWLVAICGDNAVKQLDNGRNAVITCIEHPGHEDEDGSPHANLLGETWF